MTHPAAGWLPVPPAEGMIVACTVTGCRNGRPARKPSRAGLRACTCNTDLLGHEARSEQSRDEQSRDREGAVTHCDRHEKQLAIGEQRSDGRSSR